MSYVAPRASFLGADRVWGFNVDFHGASMHTSTQGPGSVPAYSEDSDILAVNFQEPQPDGEGGLVCRRIPGEHDGKEWTSLLPTGGSNAGIAWCPTNNKFYLGVGQHQQSGSVGMVAVFDPVADTCEIIGGFSPVNGSAVAARAIWVPTESRVWVLASIGLPKVFAIIDPSDNSVTWLEDSTLVGVNDMCLVDDELWISKTLGGARIFRIDVSTLTPTLVLSETIFETWKGGAVTAWSVGVLDYIASLDEVWVAITFNEGFGSESRLLRIDPTGTILGYVSPSPGNYKLPGQFMHYSAEFDRVVLSNSTSGHLRSVNPSTLAETTVSTTDGMTACKGCHCDSINKLALPVLTGPGGARFHTVNYYSAANLGA
jgi:hypothetical protein